MKEEERRFLRALIPGVVFIVELCIVLLLILCRSQKEGIYDLFNNTNNTNINTNIIAALILVFIGSGGIGYFLGFIYRFFYWNIFPLNSWEFLEFFIKENKLDLRVITKKTERKNRKWWIEKIKDFLRLISKIIKLKKGVYKFKRNGAWRIANVIFYSRKWKSECFKGAEGRNDRLVDYMHSSGTIFTGYFVAIIIGICIGGISSFIKTKCLLLIGLFLIHLFEYVVARKNSLFFLKNIFLNDLSNYKTKKKKPLKIYIVENDLTDINWLGFKRRHKLRINIFRKIILIKK